MMNKKINYRNFKITLLLLFLLLTSSSTTGESQINKSVEDSTKKAISNSIPIDSLKVVSEYRLKDTHLYMDSLKVIVTKIRKEQEELEKINNSIERYTDQLKENREVISTILDNCNKQYEIDKQDTIQSRTIKQDTVKCEVIKEYKIEAHKKSK